MEVHVYKEAVRPQLFVFTGFGVYDALGIENSWRHKAMLHFALNSMHLQYRESVEIRGLVFP